MRPEAAEKPKESGYYWAKIARYSWNAERQVWSWENPEVSWSPVRFDVRWAHYVDETGSDEGTDWDGRNSVVVEWRPLVAPEGRERVDLSQPCVPRPTKEFIYGDQWNAYKLLSKNE